MPENQQAVYLITPKMSGFANDLLVETEDKRILYHVKAKLFAPMGQIYTIVDEQKQEVYTTKEDNTIVFPCHTVFQKESLVARVGQLGFLPQNYFLEIEKARKEVVVPVVAWLLVWLVGVGLYRRGRSSVSGEGMMGAVLILVLGWVVILNLSVDK